MEQLAKSVEALESRNAFQDDIIEQLNNELTIHQNEISEIKNQLKLLATRLKSSSTDNEVSTGIEPPPPHY